MKNYSRGLVITIVLMFIVILVLYYLVMYYRYKYYRIREMRSKSNNNDIKRKRNNKKKIVHQYDSYNQNDIDNNDKVINETKKSNKYDSHGLHYALSDDDDIISELTASNADLEIGQQGQNATNEITTTVKNDNISQTISNHFIKKWKKKVHKTSKTAKMFIRRVLMINNKNDDNTLSLLKTYENDNSKVKQTEDKSTKEDIVLPLGMLPPDSTNGTFRFSNTTSNNTTNDIEPFICLNTSDLERENYSTCEEYKIKKLRIINSPR